MVIRRIEKTKEWGFIALDYATGKTVMWQPVSDKKEYNNMAVGIMQGNNGNSIYCPHKFTDARTPAGPICLPAKTAR